jgi:hypothetical protein
MVPAGGPGSEGPEVRGLSLARSHRAGLQEGTRTTAYLPATWSLLLRLTGRLGPLLGRAHAAPVEG